MSTARAPDPRKGAVKRARAPPVGTVEGGAAANATRYPRGPKLPILCGDLAEMPARLAGNGLGGSDFPLVGRSIGIVDESRVPAARPATANFDRERA